MRGEERRDGKGGLGERSKLKHVQVNKLELKEETGAGIWLWLTEESWSNTK